MPSTTIFDVIVVGGGHNGLVAAGYIAKKGARVLVLEKAPVVGGCVRTEEIFPGYLVNKYSFEQYLIHSTPVISDLELSKFGLSYYSVDPTTFSPFLDGQSMLFYRDVERTVEHIEKFSRKDAKAYKELAEEFDELNAIIGSMALSPPVSMLELAASFKEADTEKLFQTLLSSAKEILDERFETDYVKVPIAFLGPAAIGLPPSQKGTGWTVGWHLMARNLARPRGGSGALIRALEKMLLANGCVVSTNSEVKRIVVKDEKTSGVELSDGRSFESKIVIAACDPKQTFLRLVGEDNLDPSFAKNIKRVKVANGLAMKADYALNGLPRYTCNANEQAKGCEAAATYIAPSVEALEKAYDQYKLSNNPKEPGLMVAIHTAADPSLAPEGKHILSLETRYTPFELADGSKWDEIKETEGQKLLDLFTQYCPDVKRLVTKSYVASPLDWARDLNLPNGHFLHADMSLDQLFNLRPGIGASKYETPIKGLYITGAGTHPGGGVSGAPGYNVAQVVIEAIDNRVNL